MKPLVYTLAGVVVVVALAAGPAAAQGRGGDQGGGRATSGVGPGGGGGAVASGGGGSSSGGGGGFGSGHGPASAGSGSSGGGSSSGGYSGPAPSGSSGVSSRSGGYGSPSGAGGRVSPTDGNSSYVREVYGSPGDRAVPRGSRPNPGGPSVGQAVPRWNPPVNGGGGGGAGNGGSGDGGGWYPYYPYYPYYGALGLGVYGYYYDPWWYWGSPYGYAPWGYWGSPYDSGYYGNDQGGRGGLKLRVEPTFAEVYVDGYYMGIVDDFDGTFQRMELEVGPHRIEIRAPGHETLGFDVRIEFGDTVTFRGVLQPLAKK